MAVMGSDIVDYLKQFIGTPYVWGGNDLNSGVDCSGLIVQGFKRFGIDLPRVTYDMIGEGEPVSMKGLRTGDLIYFDTDREKPGPDHVGIYMGGGKMLHAPRPGRSVEIASITSGYYMDRFMAGRRIGGVWAEGQGPQDLEDPKKVMSPEELASSYGFAYGFLQGNPELRKIFKEAIAETWSTDKFQAEVRDTEWWKSNSESMRQAEITRKTDPATWRAMVDAEGIKIRQLAAEIGAAIPEKKFRKIVETALRTNMDEDLLRNVLGEYVKFTKEGTLRGEAGMHEFTMKQYAASMGVTLSDRALKDQAQRVIRKVATVQDFQDEVRQTAKSAYPGYADQIDAGATMEDIAAPYRAAMAAELELPDSEITLNDPLIKQALNGLNKDDKPAGLDLPDFQLKLRSDPRWKQTGAAQDNMMGAGLKVLRDMGLVT